jgi:hypothetical protein
MAFHLNIHRERTMKGLLALKRDVREYTVPAIRLAASALALSGCIADVPVSPAIPQPSAAIASTPDFTRIAKNYDAELLAMADRIPGFAGVMVNDRNEIEVRIAADTVGFRAKHGPALEAFFLASAWPSLYTNVVKPRYTRVSFTAANLLRARTDFENRLTSLGIKAFSSDYDEDANQLAFGFVSRQDSAKAIVDLLRHGVAREAIRIEVREATLSLQSLKDNVPPLRGGMQINTFPNYCTVGPPIAMYSGPFILEVVTTNSHCTDAPNAVTGFQVLQTGQLVGTEIRDFPAVALSGCPSGQLCRRADLAVIQIGNVWNLNTIANTGTPHGLSFDVLLQETAPYPLTIVDQDTVVDFAFMTNLPKGAVVRKQGRTTGTTSGKITQTCVNRYSTELALTLLCQSSVAAEAGFGDSGAPVYTWVANPPWLGGNATIRGILWGGDRDQFTNKVVRYWFSPASNMAYEAPLFDR